MAAGAEAIERSHGGADIGALAVVVIIDAAHSRHQLDPVRLAAVVTQAVQQRRQRQADGAAQCQRRQGIERIVAAAYLQRVGRHQPLQGDRRRAVVLFAALAFAVFGRDCFGQPQHAVFLRQAERTRRRRLVGTEAQQRRAGRAHRHHQRVVAVEYAHGAGAEDPGLVRDIGRHVAVPVEVVLRDIEHGRRIGTQAARGMQLEARQLQHPELRQAIRIEPLAQHVECGRTDIAGHLHRQTGAFGQHAGQAGDRGLAIGAGDSQHPGRIAAFLAQGGQRLREQFDLADEGNAARICRCFKRRQFARRRQSRADRDEVDAVEQAFSEGAADEDGVRCLRLQRRQALGRGAGVGHAHGGAGARQPQRHCQPGLAKSQHQCLFAVIVHHRSFSVERPNNTSIIVMIQKRTTTWVSFQPFCS